MPYKTVAQKFGYTAGYLRFLRHQFASGKIDIADPVPEGIAARRRVSAENRQKIIAWRKQLFSAKQIADLLAQESVAISVRTIERIIAEEGFPKLPRIRRFNVGPASGGVPKPVLPARLVLAEGDASRQVAEHAGIFLFAPLVQQLGIAEIAGCAGPRAFVNPAVGHCLLALLALKLRDGRRRRANLTVAGDRSLALFAGIDPLVDRAALSKTVNAIDATQLNGLKRALVDAAFTQDWSVGPLMHLVTHPIPHDGPEAGRAQSEIRPQPATRAHRRMTLIVGDNIPNVMVYADSGYQSAASAVSVTKYLSFWQEVRRFSNPTLVFDAKFINYAQLSRLNAARALKFITFRRRGEKMKQAMARLVEWESLPKEHLCDKRHHCWVHTSVVTLPHYHGPLRQVIVRGDGPGMPAFLITNDFELPTIEIAAAAAQRQRLERGIRESIAFFYRRPASSTIPIRADIDIALTMLADTLFKALAWKLFGSQGGSVAQLCRRLVSGKGTIEVADRFVHVRYPKQKHNAVLRQAYRDALPARLPGRKDMQVVLHFD